MPTAATRPMTTAELLALPDDGKRRWLVNGELREREMTKRNRFHSAAMANIATEINVWRRGLPAPQGQVVCGEAGVRLPGEPETTVGVDVAYVPPKVLIAQTAATTLILGVPTLIVEIESPSNTKEDIDEKITAYQAAGVPLVWQVDPRWRTVTIYRPDSEPTFVNATQEIDGGDALPGFRTPVAQFFD